MFKINFERRKAERALEKALMHTEPTLKDVNDFDGVAVRVDVQLWGDDVEDLYDILGDFLKECQYDEDSFYVIDKDVMHLFGARPLTLDESVDFKKGLFDE